MSFYSINIAIAWTIIEMEEREAVENGSVNKHQESIGSAIDDLIKGEPLKNTLRREIEKKINA